LQQEVHEVKCKVYIAGVQIVWRPKKACLKGKTWLADQGYHGLQFIEEETLRDESIFWDLKFDHKTEILGITE
jgi:hypothetical protein